MKSFLIIPMGGIGKRFLKKGYKIYKSFLPVGKNQLVFDHIKKNFNKDIHIIILGSSKKVEKFFKKKKNCSFIKINKHARGPLYSIYLGLNELNSIIGNNKNIFISYTDINWKWTKADIKKITNSKACVLTHTGFHPHLECDSKADFFLCNVSRIFI